MISAAVYYSLGTLLYPLGDFSFIRNLPVAYHQCKGEDPDIDIIDFVFEHLLNLESVDAMDSDPGEAGTEKPHQPFSHIQSFSQTLTVITSPIHVKAVPRSLFSNDKRIFFTRDKAFISSDFLADIFHPPSFLQV